MRSTLRVFRKDKVAGFHERMARVTGVREDAKAISINVMRFRFISRSPFGGRSRPPASEHARHHAGARLIHSVAGIDLGMVANS
jgi:hypothetical protein